MRSRPIRLALVAGTVATLLTTSAGPVAADTLLGATGVTGISSLVEGAHCWYNNSDVLNAISVTAPNIWARNTTGGVDTQEVGWLWMVKRLKPGASSATTFFKSPVARNTATDSTKAAFVNEAIGLTLPNDQSSYQVVVKMFWYSPSGSILGTALRRFDTYTQQRQTGATVNKSHCLRSYGL